jgi:hypothetical protein
MQTEYEIVEELSNGSVIPFYGDGPIGTFKLFVAAIRGWISERSVA